MSEILALQSPAWVQRPCQKGGYFLLSMLTVSFGPHGTTGNCKGVKEKLFSFVLVYKLACTEWLGSDNFVKCVSRFCVKIRL